MNWQGFRRKLPGLNGGGRTEKATENVSGWPGFEPGISVIEVQSMAVLLPTLFRLSYNELVLQNLCFFCRRFRVRILTMTSTTPRISVTNVCTTRHILGQCLKIGHDFHRLSTFGSITYKPTETLPTYAAVAFGKFGESRNRIRMLCVSVRQAWKGKNLP
jgi:NAD/NADP transhydrogenase alpha subunit